MPYLRVTEDDGSVWFSDESYHHVLAALRACVNYWPGALNDDLQARAYESARLIVEEIDQIERIATEAEGFS